MHLVQKEDWNKLQLDKNCHPRIPDTELFQHNWGYQKPVQIHGWEWSTTFNRWSALVTFSDGWHGFTYPKPE